MYNAIMFLLFSFLISFIYLVGCVVCNSKQWPLNELLEGPKEEFSTVLFILFALLCILEIISMFVVMPVLLCIIMPALATWGIVSINWKQHFKSFVHKIINEVQDDKGQSSENDNDDGGFGW